MQTVTIRIAKRKTVRDDVAIEWFIWKDESLKSVRPKRVAAPAGLVGAAAVLRKLKLALRDEPDIDKLRQFGRQLGQSTGETKWGDLEPSCRVYLDIEDDAFKDVPWELLEQTRPNSVPLVRIKDCPVIRCSSKDLPYPPKLESRPLKVLVLVGLGKTDKIGGRREAGQLKRLFWNVDHSFDCVLADASKMALPNSNALEKLLKGEVPDILHFIGHGNASSLQIAKAGTDVVWAWGASEIELTLRNSGIVPRVVYLNACRTQQEESGTFDQTSVAEAFLRGGSLAVISMQDDVEGAAAELGARSFYQALSDGAPLDAAVQALRTGLDARTKDPYIPVLTVAARAEEIIPRRAEIDVELSRAMRTCKNLKLLERFIDRHEDRRTLIRNFLRLDADKTHSYSAAVVRSGSPNSKSGKTWFCWWWIRMCVWQHIRAYYAVPPEIKNLENLDWLEYVRAVCEGNPGNGALSPPLHADAVRQFAWEIEQIFLGKEAPFSLAPQDFHDPRRSLQEILAEERAGNDFAKKALSCFHQALKRTAGDHHLVALICDQWQDNLGLGASDLMILKNYLFDPIADEPRGPIRLIVTQPGASDPASVEQRDNPFRDVRFGPSWHEVVINDFDLTYIRELALEYIERCYPNASSDVFEQLTPVARPLSANDALKHFELMVQAFGLAAQPPSEARS